VNVPAAAPQAADGLVLASARGRWVLLATVLGSAIASIDATVVGIALPAIGRDFNVGLAALQWVVTAYTMTLAGLLLLAGAMGDKYGRKKIFLIGVIWFALASLLCAVAPGATFLIMARALQGVGAALLTPGSLAILEAVFRPDDRGKAIGAWSGFAGVGTAIGPFIGGYLVQAVSWRLIFVINLPLGAIAVGVALWLVPNAREATQHALDYIGFALTGVGLATLVYSLELLSAETINWTRATVALTTGAVMLTFDIRHLRRTAHPLFDLDLLRIATYRVAVAGGTVFRIAIGAVPFLLPLLFQNEFGWTPLKSGLLVMVVFIGNIVIKPVTTPLLRSFGFQRVLVVAATAGAVTIALCALIGPTTPTALDCAVLFAGGVFRSIGFTAYNTIGFADIPLASLVSANSLIATVTQLATGLAVTIGAIMLRLGGPLSRLFGLSGSGADAFTAALILISLVALVPVVQSWRLHPDAGLRISSRPPPR